MKIIFSLFCISLYITQILSLCGEPAPCGDQACCTCRQNPNLSNGNGFYEYIASCLSGGLHCVDNSGCRLCWKPTFAAFNVGSRPVCQQFLGLSSGCSDDACCIANQNGNEEDGNGFMEFNQACKDNGGGLHCIHDTGCRLCYKPVIGGTNVGPRPTCARFL